MSTASLTADERAQRAHYDRIAEDYERHYADPCSQAFRHRFFHGAMLEGVDLQGRHVLEAMCGGGTSTGDLLARGARVTGLDISSVQVDYFRSKWPQCAAVCGSVLASGLDDESIDCVVVVGGLHHVHPHVDEAIDEIHRILRPGGYFCFVEPHAGSLPDLVRRAWYRCDPLFEDNERAVDLCALESRNGSRFEFLRAKYMGNVAYLLVYNSLVFRVPRRLKWAYTPLLLRLESLIARFQGRRLSCFVACQWRKR